MADAVTLENVNYSLHLHIAESVEGTVDKNIAHFTPKKSAPRNAANLNRKLCRKTSVESRFNVMVTENCIFHSASQGSVLVQRLK